MLIVKVEKNMNFYNIFIIYTYLKIKISKHWPYHLSYCSMTSVYILPISLTLPAVSGSSILSGFVGVLELECSSCSYSFDYLAWLGREFDVILLFTLILFSCLPPVEALLSLPYGFSVVLTIYSSGFQFLLSLANKRLQLSKIPL